MISFAVSSIAWTPGEDDLAYAMLRETGIASLEAVPLRLCPEGFEQPAKALGPVLQKLNSFGLSISGFQSIFYGRNDLNLFNSETRPEFVKYFGQILRLCAEVGGKYVVFGAPAARKIPDKMSASQAREIAMDFFSDAGNLASSLGISIGIEPVPEDYGGNFLRNISETSELVRMVSTAGLHLHLDTGEMAINKEDYPDVIMTNKEIIRSLHVSEPFLTDFTSPWEGHRELAPILKTHCGSWKFSLEMRRPETGLAGLRCAISFMKMIYG